MASDEELNQAAERLGRILKDERERLELRQEDVAARMGIGQSAYSRYETASKLPSSGRGALNFSVIFDLEDALGLERWYLAKILVGVGDVVDVETALVNDPNLPREVKRGMLDMYRFATQKT